VNSIFRSLKRLQEKSDSASHLAFAEGRCSQDDAFTTYVMRGGSTGADYPSGYSRN